MKSGNENGFIKANHLLGKQTRSDLKQLRKSGKVPAVVYGYGTKNVSVKVDEVEFIKVIRE